LESNVSHKRSTKWSGPKKGKDGETVSEFGKRVPGKYVDRKKTGDERTREKKVRLKNTLINESCSSGSGCGERRLDWWRKGGTY